MQLCLFDKYNNAKCGNELFMLNLSRIANKIYINLIDKAIEIDVR